MATRTSTTSGLASAGTTWVGGVAPVNGDIVIVATGNTVTFDASISLGSKASGIGTALTIQATDGVTFGRVLVNSGITLTLNGFDNVNFPLNIQAFGEFAPQSGSTVLLGTPSDGATWVNNNGIVTSNGVAWSTATAPTWNTAVTGAVGSTQTAYYDADLFTLCYPLQVGIANAAGTALGSLGDSSLTFASLTPAGIFATEVATLALVNGAGKYYVDYTNGHIFWYQTSTANFNFNPSYKKLAYVGTGIKSFGNTDGNQVTFTNNTVTYLGDLSAGSGGNNYFLYCKNKFTSSGTLRNFQCTGNTFIFCRRIIGLDNCIGTSGSPININDNVFSGYDGDAYGYAIAVFRASNSFVSIQRNTSKGVDGSGIAFIQGLGSAGNQFVQTSWTIKDNIAMAAQFIDGGSPDQVVWPDCVMNTTCLGLGAAFDTRQIVNFAGTVGHPAIIDGTLSWRAMRAINVGSYETIRNSIMGYNYHHSINGPSNTDDILVTGVDIDHVLSIKSDGGGFAEPGYNRRQWIDGWTVSQNTIYASSAGTGGLATGAINYGDSYDNGGPQLMTAGIVSSNITEACYNSVYLRPDTTTYISRPFLINSDYNAVHGSIGADYTGLSRFSTFTGITNVTGVSPYNPSYAAPISGKTLSLVVTSPTNQTLSWDGGATQQIVQFSGTLTSAGVNNAVGGLIPYSANITDTSKTFDVNMGSATCPTGGWVKFTSGTQSGNIFRITRTVSTTVLTIVAAFVGTAPSIGDAYIIVFPQVTLTSLAGGNTIVASIDLRLLPGVSRSDTNVSMTLNSITADPQFVDKTRTLKTWDSSLGGPGTEDSAYARLYASPTLARTSAIPYIKAGFAPTNIAYRNTGYTGTDIGAIPFGGSIGGSSSDGSPLLLMMLE